MIFRHDTLIDYMVSSVWYDMFILYMKTWAEIVTVVNLALTPYHLLLEKLTIRGLEGGGGRTGEMGGVV